MTQHPEALRLAERLPEIAKYSGSEYWDDLYEAADELRRLHEAHDWQYRMAGERLGRIEKAEARITTLEAALEQALEALETVVADAKTTPNAYEAQRQAIAALRAAIEQAPRQWQGLTEIEFRMLYVSTPDYKSLWEAIEAKLKEKNG